MGLKSYQQVWLELLSDQAIRDNWFTSQENHHDLTPSEFAHLSSVTPQNLNQWAQEGQKQHSQKLNDLFPEGIRFLLGPEHTQKIIAQVLSSEAALPPLYPRARSLSRLLNQVLKYLTEKQLLIPHLRDLIAYELAAVHLEFFSLPRINPPKPGPILSSWARVVSLGRHFPYVLERLSLQQDIPKRSESPRQNFLLLRDFRGLKLEALAPILAHCLQACNGQKTWDKIISKVLAEEAESNLQLEKEALQAWLEQYLKRGILIQNN